MFEVMVIGAGDAFTARHRTTAVLLMAQGRRLAIDCPDTYRRALAEACERAGRLVALESVEDVLITHVHGDHVNGLEGLAFYKHFVEQKRLRLIATREVRDVLWDQRLRASMSTLWDGTHFRSMQFDDYFEYIPLDPSREIIVGPFRIESRLTHHHVPTSALRIEASGRMLGYSADTAFDPSLIEWLGIADTILHETNAGPAHTPYERLAELPEAVRAKMRLIHYSDQFDPGASVIPVVREGDVLTV